MFGNFEIIIGGRVFKFYVLIRFEVRKIIFIIEGKDIIGNEIKIKVVKNKLSVFYKSFIIEILFFKGIDVIGELIELFCEKGIFDKKGVWYVY